ncbi:MAG: SDR family oxidoreductase [Variovorax sp.]
MHVLEGKVAVVTGGAGGIGAAICETLAQAGAAVVVGYNSSKDAAQALAARLPRVEGPAHQAMAVPVTDSAALADLARAVERDYARCDILVNCHGTTRFVPHPDLDALDDALIDQVLATNVRGAFATVRALRPMLKASGDGLVVNISSIAATLGLGSNIMYCASKAALDNMTKSLARALAPEIRVVSVAPGLVQTEFTKSFDPAWVENYLRSTPLHRMVPPEHIGRAVLAVASYLPSSTGIVVAADAGRLLS